ncbi:hypothetical protein CIW48_27180 [Methylobacterium sp. P1-11]|uniref:hypothetical protein n=1 Tax=Methylobacterium sp. P1-11 TaxID=2024616 RepID=UPI0011EC835E|nr:hypothetical protein [Methylobacterium sp. P1-11]KAA0117887.1 hypothetical protein CIW48_27180 [Methylobacterium sp. P1-11]
MDNTIASFLVALGFDVNQGSLNTAKKSVADYEKAVRDAEQRIEDARWEGAKTADEIAKLTREANLKEARAALATAQEREKAEKETARKREERNKEFMAGMSRLALAATAAATAISYAVNRVTQAFDNLGFVSARTGASVQSLNSLGYAFKQVGGSSGQAISAVEKFAQALRQNDGLKAYVQSLGVDTTKDMADQLLDTVDALSKHEYQVGSREAGMLGISEEDYKLLTQYAAKVKEYRTEYDATTKALGVNSKEAADASMAFQRTLTRLQATVSALGDKLMVSLAPALEQIVKRFQEWISANPEKVERIMRGISDAVVWLAEKLSAMVTWFAGNEGDAFMKRWDAFADRVKAIASAFETIFGVLKKIASVTQLSTILGGYDKVITSILAGPAAFERANGGPGVVVTPGATAGPVRDTRSIYQRYAPTILGGKPDPNAPTDTRGGLRARAARAMRGDQSGGVAANPGAYKDVLDHIARSEGTAHRPGGGYNTSLANGLLLPGGKEQDLTKLTLDEIDALQTGMLRNPANSWNSSAIGRYQVVRTTLRAQREKLGLKGTDLYDEKLQDRIGANLARQRGADPVGLKNEWASLVGAKNATAVALMQKVDPKASTMPLERQPIEIKAPKIEVKGADGSAAPPQIHVPGVPRMMQMPGFDARDYMKPAPEASSSVVNSGGNSTKTVTQTFHNKTTITGAENPKQAAGIMENAFGRMHDLALANAQSATV